MLVDAGSRQPRREEGEREGEAKEEEKKKKTVEGENQASLNLVRMRTRALSNRNVVFLLSQVSHLRWKKGKNRVKVQEK